MAGEETSPGDQSARSGQGSPSWEPYQSPQSSRGGVWSFLRRYSFSITVVAAALAVGALIYFSPKRLSSEQASGGLTPDQGSNSSTISVYSEPAGAAVIVGADTVGMTPVENHQVASGTYLVTVEKDNYVDRDTALTLAADQSLVYSPQLRQEQAEPSAEQDEPQARSTTEDFGTDPPQEEQPEGSSTPTTSDAAGSSGASQEQEPGSETSADADSDPLVTGVLEIRSEPGSTAVEINGYEVGSTPMRLDQVAAGTHEVTLRHPGYETVTRTVRVTGNGTRTVEASLEALTGHLRVLVRPWGSIFINGEEHAEDSDVWYETELRTGTYTVTARHPSLGEQAQAVEVVARDTQSVVLNIREQ